MAMEMAKSVAAVKSSVYSVQLSLLDGVSDEKKLQAAGKVLTQSEYADVVTERSIVSMCGYPLCTNPLPLNFSHKGRYRISLSEHKVYDLQETRLYCSSHCLVSSKNFAASLALERDHSTKAIELAAAFHNLGLQDVDQASLLAMEKGRPKIQELDQQNHQDTPMPIDKQGLHLTVPVETMTTQHQQPDAGTFLLICEQNEIKISDVQISGPSNAIEGYIPQKEVRAPHHKRVTDQNKKKTIMLSTADESSIGFGNSVKKTEKGAKKEASLSKFKESASPYMEPEFTSCILVNQGVPAVLHDASCKSEPVSSCSESIEAPTSHRPMDEQKRVQQRSKRQNRVSWADHNNLSLVEELSPSSAASSSAILVDTYNSRVHEESCTQAAMPELTSRSGFLQRQHGFCRRKEQENTSRKVAAAGRGSSASTQRQENCRKEQETIERVHGEEGDEAVMPDMVTSREVAVVVKEGSASLQIQNGKEEEHGNIHGTDSRDENLDCAQALVAALTDAAEAVAHGEVDSSEAAARAGISIVFRNEAPSSHPLDLFIKEKESNEDLEEDIENIDPRDCWYSAPPKDFKPELSKFGTLWMALDGWISAASIAHVYGRDSNEEDNFAFLNGKEYLKQVIISNGVSAEIERTLAGCMARALPGLVETLRFPVPISTLEASLGRFLRTMTFMKAVPPFSSKQWQVVVLLLLDALSVHRLPTLRTRFLNGRHLLQKVLACANITEAEYEIFRDLVLPMGMLPDFAAHCGG